jgi:hypothetical protein
MQIQNFFLIDFDIWNIEIGVRMRKLWLFYKRTLNYRTKRSESGKNLRRWLEIDGNKGEKDTNWTLTRPIQQQDLDQDKLNTADSKTEICRGYGAEGL